MFIFSTVIFNAWVLANAILAHEAGIHISGRAPVLPMQCIRDMVSLYCVYGDLLRFLGPPLSGAGT